MLGRRRRLRREFDNGACRVGHVDNRAWHLESLHRISRLLLEIRDDRVVIRDRRDDLRAGQHQAVPQHDRIAQPQPGRDRGLKRCAGRPHQAVDGHALAQDEALALYRGLDQPSLGLLANDVRTRLNPPGEDGETRVTYIVDRNLNPTNVCVTDCGFCAFYRSPGDADAYILPREVIYQKVEELVAQGGTQLLLQGGHHPKLKTDWYAELFQDLKQRYPEVWIHGMSPPETTHVAKMEKRPVQDVLADLKAAGLQSIPGGGAEILDACASPGQEATVTVTRLPSWTTKATEEGKEIEG